MYTGCMIEMQYNRFSKSHLMISPFLLVRFMPPDDPLGKNGPTLDQFLRKKVKLPSPLPQPCPYGKKCTYGNKCKFYHPDRATNQKSITDKLKEHSSQRINEVRARVNSRDSSPGNVVLAFYTKGQVPWENILNWKDAPRSSFGSNCCPKKWK